MIKHYYKSLIFALLSISAATTVIAQSLEPRAYSNAPVGMNFLLAGYQNSQGALLFDPAIPITDASANVDVALIAYVHSMNIAGKSAKIGALLPYASLSANGNVDGVFRTRETTGMADPSLFFSMNFYGAPALSLTDFRNYQQDTIIGFTLKVTAPLGAYDTSKLINIGTNRWSVEPGLGISKALGKWTMEASTAIAFYTNNDEFDQNKTRKQAPVYSTQVHLTYSFPNKIWAAASATYYSGGRSTIDNIQNNDLQQNWRVGFTLALPVNRYNSIKIFASDGISARTGSNFNILGIAWQYRWGAGL